MEESKGTEGKDAPPPGFKPAIHRYSTNPSREMSLDCQTLRFPLQIRGSELALNLRRCPVQNPDTRPTLSSKLSALIEVVLSGRERAFPAPGIL